MLLLAASANAGPLDEIGTKVAEAISAFIGVVTAIGMAAITVIVAIQGFKLAWGMIKTIK
ncbi:major capsid protein [Alysiella sp.]|uniref:major capsid protein n=1 Tax=Alysiella sp. TaxID=1872483 RepID=UPI0034C5C562